MTGESTRSQVLQDNERIKHAATAVTAWANALVIASGGKWALGGFDAYVLLWAMCALSLLWAASQSLTMLEDKG